MNSALTLDDKYLQTEGRVYLSSIQALIRVLLDQARRDRLAGLNTAGFVSGYRGSPLGTFDNSLWSASKLLEQSRVRFLPGLNEELAATSVRGTQELGWFGKAQVEGVFGMWYGKGLGADRAHEALKLGNLEGASATGGVLAVVGDDHGGKSSVSSHQSEQVLMAAHLPILYPSGTAEIVEYGLFGYALSRYSGLYVALKCVTDTLDLTSSIVLPDATRPFAIPADCVLPPGGLNLRPAVAQLAQEELTVNHRLPAAQAFVRANAIDRIVIDTARPRLVIATAGKAYRDTRQALDDLGFDENKCAALGIRVYKPALVWPLDPVGALRAVADAATVLVVEEKRPVIEDQLASILFGSATRPRLLGKRDGAGKVLLQNFGELNPTHVREALMRVLGECGLVDEAAKARHAQFDTYRNNALMAGGAPIHRPASFCSGCPHNTGTRVPDGSTAMGATGCHAMPAYQPGATTMRPMTMGAEGMPFLGVSHLVEMPHMFTNMGDGTYAHSGLLAIRAAVAAGASITYKILYNDAVAMTGGQPVEGSPSPYAIAAQLKAEGVDPVVAVYDPAEAFNPNFLPDGVEAFERSELDKVQKTLRDKKGVSALIYVQTCAAEKRRRRKRKQFPDPDKRVYINPDVCEGCGDCSVQSNCIAINPLDTELGRKRVIDQSACNKDFSCLKGFCPSFVTVEGARIARRPAPIGDLAAACASLPVPLVAGAANGSYNVLITGVGGTGVLTVGAILGMAAHLDGNACSIMDMTGMAQKGGAVTSHIRVAADAEAIHNARFDLGMTDTLIGCDLIVSAGADVLRTLKRGHTRAILNTDVASTGEFARNPTLDLDSGRLAAIVEKALGTGTPARFAASELAMALTGDAIATNMLMLGYAAQRGLLPVSLDALEEAIRINGTAVAENLAVFAAGRLAAATPERLPTSREQKPPVDNSIDGILASRAKLLEAYQNRAYAQTYLDFVADIRERADARAVQGSDRFVREVAMALGKLMAYKDEYEVARLFSTESFWRGLHEQFEGDFKVSFNLAPPVLPGTDPATGRPKKRRFGPAMKHGFRLLQRFRFLRGSRFDPFGYHPERRMERRLIGGYRATVSGIVDRLTPENIDTAIALVSAASDIRGYGPVKMTSVKTYENRRDELIKAFESARHAPQLENA
ncbi:indolepyruvate ferredoxin oxidoreductase family protein [Caballeronia sp. AZ7_KS35]|uniref:indolepyruvate ferredoxin oxidoreductase family protein n=1 Tax=Caballeronia sp. AZ7_KS35 TaxID=2921762 RepID=UPI0020292886|nr:indolepyruvate ferredoxin oxidoreductase family protein [Caballeronia sp. AZ7_KS35]